MEYKFLRRSYKLNGKKYLVIKHGSFGDIVNKWMFERYPSITQNIKSIF